MNVPCLGSVIHSDSCYLIHLGIHHITTPQILGDRGTRLPPFGLSVLLEEREHDVVLLIDPQRLKGSCFDTLSQEEHVPGLVQAVLEMSSCTPTWDFDAQNTIRTQGLRQMSLGDMLDCLLNDEDSCQQDTTVGETTLQITNAGHPLNRVAKHKCTAHTQQNDPQRQSVLITSKLSMKTQGSLASAICPQCSGAHVLSEAGVLVWRMPPFWRH